MKAAASLDADIRLSMTLPLLAGVLVSNYHWATVAVLGALGVSLVVREMIEKIRSADDE